MSTGGFNMNKIDNNVCTNCGGRGYFVHYIHEYNCNICKGIGKALKTFEELKELTTEDIFSTIVKLAEGFYLDEEGYLCWYKNTDISLSYPLIFNTSWWIVLLYRAVEGWNKSNNCMTNITAYGSHIEHGAFDEKEIYFFKDYTSCQLTPCEMAMWDCLLGVLK